MGVRGKVSEGVCVCMYTVSSFWTAANTCDYHAVISYTGSSTTQTSHKNVTSYDTKIKYNLMFPSPVVGRELPAKLL